MVGIGGGIFLAPILHHLKWDKPISIAASSFFIGANSSSLLGIWSSGTFEVSFPQILVILLSVLLGGQLGVRWSLSKFSSYTVRFLTAILVLLVGLRVLLTHGFQIQFFS